MSEETINNASMSMPAPMSSPPPNPRIQSWKNFYKKLRKNKAAMVGGFLVIFFIIVAIIGPYFTPYEPNAQNHVNKLAGPSAEHWFGTDHHGRDIFSRIIHGMSITFYVGLLSVMIGAAFGIFLESFRDITENVLMP